MCAILAHGVQFVAFEYKWSSAPQRTDPEVVFFTTGNSAMEPVMIIKEQGVKVLRSMFEVFRSTFRSLTEIDSKVLTPF